ncbi:NAD(P)-binding protein [Mycena galericulata]|nr:NAD(P)-binding protein [Mycena galericulata]
MPSLATVRAANASFAPSYLPVAVFVGGTSGIGRATAEAFARYTNGNAHIILVGRNATAAAEILASFPKPQVPSSGTGSGWKHEFVECDASLLRNVHTTVAALLARLPRINFLALSAGYFSLAGRADTAEGLDRKLVLSYYARAAFIAGLLPALSAARAAGEPANALSVLAAGLGPAVDLQNLGLERGYSGKAAMDASATYTELMVEELASRHPTIAFTHVYPGFVDTPLFNFTHWAARLAAPLIKAGVFLMAKSAKAAGEYTLYGLLQGENAPNAHHRGEHGDELQKAPTYGRGSSEASRALWAHTEAVIAAKALL